MSVRLVNKDEVKEAPYLPRDRFVARFKRQPQSCSFALIPNHRVYRFESAGFEDLNPCCLDSNVTRSFTLRYVYDPWQVCRTMQIARDLKETVMTGGPPMRPQSRGASLR